LGDAEISSGFLMGRLMHALHITMVNATPAGQPCPLGVSFPGYRDAETDRDVRSEISGSSEYQSRVLGPPIGKSVRLFARDASELDSIQWSRSMVGLDDYIHRTGVRKVPTTAERHFAFARHQPKASPQRLIRRAMKRKGIDEAEARRRYAGYQMDTCRLPYVDMRSESSGDYFRVFVERLALDPSDRWRFSTYGLSRTVALPDF
jgi:CRISPR-associated endonuclease Csy4